MVLGEEEIVKILKQNLRDVPEMEIERVAQAICKATGKWQEVDLNDSLGAIMSVQCKDICAIGDAFSKGYCIRTFICKNPI